MALPRRQKWQAALWQAQTAGLRLEKCQAGIPALKGDDSAGSKDES